VRNSLCPLLLLDGSLGTLGSLYNALLPLVDVHIVRTGGSSDFFLRVMVDPREVEGVNSLCSLLLDGGS
jgi:hypothetical protein